MMKKFFNVEKWKTKNRNIVEVLNTLMGWMFFAVACCVALFVCFYSFGNDNVVYGAEADYPLKIEFCNINGELLDNQSIGNFCEEMYYSVDDGTNWHNWQNDGIKIGSGSVQIKIKNRKFKTTTSYYCAMGEDGNVVGTADLSFEGSLEPSEEIITISLDNLNLTGTESNVGSICIRFLVINKFDVTLKGNGEYCLADRATVSFRGNLIEGNDGEDYTIEDVESGIDKSIIVTPKLGYVFYADKTASFVNVKLVKSDGNDENVQCELKTEEEKYHPVKSIIIDISKFTEDTTFKIDNIVFDKYKIKFMSEIGDYNDENGFVKNDVAKVYLENSESPIDIKSILMEYKTPRKFTIKMENKYNKSSINLKLLTDQNDQETKSNEEESTAGSAVIEVTLGEDEIKYYADKEFVEIYICNITLNKYDVKFSLDKGNLSDIADIKICEYEPNGSGSDYEYLKGLNGSPLKYNGDYMASDYCPHGKSFAFRIELKKWYRFNKLNGIYQGTYGGDRDENNGPIKELITNIDSVKSAAPDGVIMYKFEQDDKEGGGHNGFEDAFAYVYVDITRVVGDLEINLNSSTVTVMIVN